MLPFIVGHDCAPVAQTSVCALPTSPVPRSQFSPAPSNTPPPSPAAPAHTPPTLHPVFLAHSASHPQNSAPHTRTLRRCPTAPLRYWQYLCRFCQSLASGSPEHLVQVASQTPRVVALDHAQTARSRPPRRAFRSA